MAKQKRVTRAATGLSCVLRFFAPIPHYFSSVLGSLCEVASPGSWGVRSFRAENPYNSLKAEVPSEY
jgi:hypothetical protein